MPAVSPTTTCQRLPSCMTRAMGPDLPRSPERDQRKPNDKELQSKLMVSAEPPRGKVRLAEWMAQLSDSLGRTWASELDRHFDRR